jgi:hypothetical protein
MATNLALDELLDSSPMIRSLCARVLGPGAPPLKEPDEKEELTLEKWLAEYQKDAMKSKDLQRGETDPTVIELLRGELNRCNSAIHNLEIILSERELGDTRRQALIDFLSDAIDRDGVASRIDNGWIQVIKEHPKAGAEAWAAYNLDERGPGMQSLDVEVVCTLLSSFDPKSDSISRKEVLTASGFTVTDDLELLRVSDRKAAELRSQYRDLEARVKSYLEDIENGKTSSDAFSECTPQ